MLNSGQRLGPYEIVSPLGAGGMGEVYKARDTRLQREVALKVLPDSVANDRESLRRFQQEARAVAALNHPNILGVHDVGEQHGTHYIISELLEGETLRDKLNAGALLPRRAIDYALQITHGLAAAHEKGVVHRDLKPENLFVTKDGRLKILDFGLARHTVLAGAQAAPDDATLTSVDVSPTTPGMVMGTVGYMSPEQVRGQAVDYRSDIFAFGAVMYEMFSGRRAFKRDSAAETMTAILKEDPPEFSGAVHVPAGAERIMRRCLEKDPGERFQSAKDLAFALEALSGSSQAAAAQSVGAPARPTRLRTVAIVALFLPAAIALAYFAGARRSTGPALFERLTFERGYVKGGRFTSDGKNVIYSAMWEGRPYEVFTMRIGDHTARSLGLKNAMVVGVSASGDLAVLSDVRRARTTNRMQVGTLARVPVSGGGLREILDDVWDADISADGRQFAVVRTPAGEQQLEYPIGKALFKTNGYISDPRISPDGKLVAFMEHPLFGDDRGYVDVADGKNVKHLTQEISSERGLAWSPDGREIWYGATAVATTSEELRLFAVTLDGKSREVFNVPGNVQVWDIAPDGRLLFSHETVSSAQMVISPVNTPPRNVSVLGYGLWGSISDDGKSVAFTESGPGSGDDYLIFFRKLDGSPAIELGVGSNIGLSPDGKNVVALVPSQRTKIRIYPTGAGETRSIDVAPVEVDRYFVSWLPGHQEFSFLGHEGDGPPHAYRVSLQGGPVRPLTPESGAHFWNRVSPDGKLVAEGTGIGTTGQGVNVIVDVATGRARPAPWDRADEIVDWDDDGRHIFVARESDEGATIFRVDTATGKRDLWTQVRPADPAGILSVSRFFITPSGNAYGYSESRILSALYVYSQQ